MVFVCGKLGFYSFINMGLTDRFVSHGSVSRIGCVYIGGNGMTDQPTQEAVNKLLGKKKFVIYARETIYYEVSIDAYTEDEVWEMANNGDVSFPYSAVVDGADFDIYEVSLHETEEVA